MEWSAARRLFLTLGKRRAGWSGNWSQVQGLHSCWESSVSKARSGLDEGQEERTPESSVRMREKQSKAAVHFH